MAKDVFLFLTLAFAFALLATSAMGQVSGESFSDLKAPFIGASLTCAQTQPQSERIAIRRPFAKRAQLKARLLNLLHDSLHDDAEGIVNVRREKEIQALASKLRSEKNR